MREREREREDRGLTQEATASVKVVNTFELCMKGKLAGDDGLRLIMVTAGICAVVVVTACEWWW